MTRFSRPRRIEAAALVVFFCAALLAPLIYQCTHRELTEDLIEKRPLAKLPRVPKKWKRIAAWDKFPAAFEKYYNDHFGLRDALLQSNAWMKLTLFHTSPTPDVSCGLGGWFFYAANGCMDDYRGLSRLTKEQLQGWKALLEGRQRWLAVRGVHYLFVFTPNKQSIYPENLPAGITKLREGTALDQLLAYLRANTTVPILDLRPTLLAHKDQGQLFYRTDTHWNSLGTYFGYAEILRRMHELTPELAPRPLLGIRGGPAERKRGDLAAMARSTADRVEFADVTLNQISSVKRQPIKFPDGTFISDNALVATDYPQAATPLRAVVLRDSYFQTLQPFFSPHFARAVFIWRPVKIGRLEEQRAADVVETEKPQWFVEEMVERFIGLRVPAAEDVFGGPGRAVALPEKSP